MKTNFQRHIAMLMTRNFISGEYLEVDMPSNLTQDDTIAIEPCTNKPSYKHTKASLLWPQPQIVETVGDKIRIMNTSNEPHMVRRNDHVCFARPTENLIPSTTITLPVATNQPAHKKDLPTNFSETVQLGPDNQIPDPLRNQLRQKFDSVFNPDIPGYNGAAGHIEATVNMGPVQPPQSKVFPSIPAMNSLNYKASSTIWNEPKSSNNLKTLA